MYLIENSILCPIGNAVVERLFSLLKIVKTDMRNSLGDPNLDKILRINKEAPKTLSDMELEIPPFSSWMFFLDQKADWLIPGKNGIILL